MFSNNTPEKKLVDLRELKKTTDLFFRNFHISGLLASESNWILDSGSELLETISNPTKEQFDQIIVGTLLFALMRNDIKYKHANYNQFCIEKTYEDILIALESRTSDEHAKVIPYIGKKTLIDKEIHFSGVFSCNSAIEKKIKSGLPFINSDYFASYGISAIAENTQQSSSSLNRRN